MKKLLLLLFFLTPIILLGAGCVNNNQQKIIEEQQTKIDELTNQVQQTQQIKTAPVQKVENSQLKIERCRSSARTQAESTQFITADQITDALNKACTDPKDGGACFDDLMDKIKESEKIQKENEYNLIDFPAACRRAP